MDQKHEHYLQQAEVCRAEAMRMQTHEMREGWLKIAQAWLDMLPRNPLRPQFDRMTDAMATGQEDSAHRH
jgi:hypothetical protein